MWGIPAQFCTRAVTEHISWWGTEEVFAVLVKPQRWQVLLSCTSRNLITQPYIPGLLPVWSSSGFVAVLMYPNVGFHTCLALAQFIFIFLPASKSLTIAAFACHFCHCQVLIKKKNKKNPGSYSTLLLLLLGKTNVHWFMTFLCISSSWIYPGYRFGCSLTVYWRHVRKCDSV